MGRTPGKYCVNMPMSYKVLNNAIITHLYSVYNINPICKYQIKVCTCHISNSISGISHFLTTRFKHLECKKRYTCEKVGKALPFP